MSVKINKALTELRRAKARLARMSNGKTQSEIRSMGAEDVIPYEDVQIILHQFRVVKKLQYRVNACKYIDGSLSEEIA
jgi:hypothetical protein